MRDYSRGTELAPAEDTHWDEFIHDGWYAGQMPPPLPSTTVSASQSATTPEPIDPAARPGLLSLRPQVKIFVPIVFKGP